MGFNTPFNPENNAGALFEASWYKIQRHTKTAVVNMLGNFFSARVQLYRIQMPEILGLRNSSDVTNIFVNQDFPYMERKLPMILVAIKSGRQQKMNIGADNLLYHDVRDTSTGKTAVEIFAGAAKFSLALIALSQSPEERMKIMEMIYACFTHYYNWQYFYTYGDGNMFSIVPTTTELAFGSEQEVEGDQKTSMIYINDITMESFVEYTFRGTDIYPTLTEVEFSEEESGPITYSEII